MLTIHAVGSWARHQVHVTWQASTRQSVPEVERLIEQAWIEAQARPGIKLFDGPMCRMESWSATPDALRLALSQTSYKPFLGTNLVHPELSGRFGPAVMANPVGVSSAVVTSDRYLMLGRRNMAVAYYPGRTHPFAGALEPRDGRDVFAAVVRELREELSLGENELGEITCTGLAEDQALRQPELLFSVPVACTRARLESQVDATEHRASIAIETTRDALGGALSDPALTPVAVAALLLCGRIEFGQPWFERYRAVARATSP
jgi:hypothetical protein